MVNGVLLIAVLLSVTVQLKRPVPPVFLAADGTVNDSASMLTPSMTDAFQPAHDAVPSSLLETKPMSTNGPAPHLTSLSACTLQSSQVSLAVAVIFFRCAGFVGSADPTISHVTE